LRPQHDLTGLAAPVHHFGDGHAATALANAFILVVGTWSDFLCYGATLDQQLVGRALIDCGKAKETDLFIFRMIVSPEPRTYTLSLRAQEGDPANETH